MKPELTLRQNEVFEAIKIHIEKAGFPPTMLELARLIGCASPNAAVEHVKSLKKKGYITVAPGAARGITVVKTEWDADPVTIIKDLLVVLEDDAMPVAGFTDLVGECLNRFPDSLVSFYLGTGRPPQYQMQIAERLIVADKTQADYITLPRLIHGVCYSVPSQHIERVLSRWVSSKPADYAVGDAYGGTVVYPCYSLVDHADGEPVERHPDSAPRTERRRAWRLHV
ncbi:hypothetical protein [Enterobacter hormaechei]|uniref:LexA family protein n=1 Tax=Enterobacter TaxID=547 RepID=UPI00135DB997|nr:hypothetical protein [Enterobacter hormaechei]GJK33576.1 hypothetical protein TUM17557_05740 [Enterobacter cloacae]GJL06266.1 hypothetical protein TUM17571_05740 [Klebsiella pneumoniae]MDU7830635.1 hypothetical protein [Enterobacter hormaechei]MXS65153.1 hypothetical protein [Enterobacter hormaechei]WMA68017.1 hypothetical protein QPR63_08870 [Enterobacter hormaechei]